MSPSKADKILTADLKQHDKKEQGSDQSNINSRSSSRSRSFSDVGLTAISPTPSSRNSIKKAWKDDILIAETSNNSRKLDRRQNNWNLKMPPLDLKQHDELLPAPPNLEKYTTNMLPRRSRGMDYSRAATNLHHSTLADQSSPDSSPITASRAMNIMSRVNGLNSSGCGDLLHNTNPPWSTSGNVDQINLSSSLDSINMMESESSQSCSDEDDLMDDIDDSKIRTPHVKLYGDLNQEALGYQWQGLSPINCSPIDFQRKSMRNSKKRKNFNGVNSNKPLSLITRSSDVVSSSNSGQVLERLLDARHKRSESITRAANKLRISGNENDDGIPITSSQDGQRGVIRRPVTRRGNMLPKTKGFARIQAALAEENAPVESEVLREAAVIRQTLESDIEYEPRQPLSIVPPSPILVPTGHESLKASEESHEALIPPTSKNDFKEKALLNSKSKDFWTTFGEDNNYSTPHQQTFPRTFTSGTGIEMSIDSPINAAMSPFPYDSPGQQPFSSSRPATPQPGVVPMAVDITQKLSKKRFRDDDFDLCSFKRRAVSPSMSAHNSPVIKSPMQRDHTAWGNRPPSSCNIIEAVKSPVNAIQKRIGLQGMIDTNDSLMKMSIE